MGRDRGEINFHLDSKLKSSEWMELLHDFGLKGWNYRNKANSSLFCTALDEDFIDWDGVELSDASLEKLISQKLAAREPFGIAIQYTGKDNSTPSDNVVLFQKDCMFSIWLSDKALDIKDHAIVDYSYYLPIFIPLVYKFRKPFDLSITAYVDRV